MFRNCWSVDRLAASLGGLSSVELVTQKLWTELAPAAMHSWKMERQDDMQNEWQTGED
jgi:hypothetical protein